MSRLKSDLPRRQRAAPRAGLTLDEALLRIQDPDDARSLSVFFAELERAQREGDSVMMREARRAISLVLRAPSKASDDLPLMSALRAREAKGQRRARRED